MGAPLLFEPEDQGLPVVVDADLMPAESAPAHRVVMGVLRRTCGSDGSRRAGGVSEVPAADYSLGGTTATRRALIRPGGPAEVLREDGDVRGRISGVSGARPPSPVIRSRVALLR